MRTRRVAREPRSPDLSQIASIRAVEAPVTEARQPPNGRSNDEYGSSPAKVSGPGMFSTDPERLKSRFGRERDWGAATHLQPRLG